MELKSIKIDSAFPDYGTGQLQMALNSGWSINDKTVTSERYIVYLLRKSNDVQIAGTPDSFPELLQVKE